MKKYDASKASYFSKFIFTDQDGDVFESNLAPVLCENGWRGTGDCKWVISKCKPYLGDWMESLESI
jgi:hypothetical protein